MRALHALFADAFGPDGGDAYTARPPSDAWLAELLARRDFVALAARRGGQLAGGLTAYELAKPEQERRELYLYDLAVAAAHRRRGVATALVRHLQRHAAERGAWVVFVQADRRDRPAVALYSRLGRAEAVLHFDLPADPGAPC